LKKQFDFKFSAFDEIYFSIPCSVFLKSEDKGLKAIINMKSCKIKRADEKI